MEHETHKIAGIRFKPAGKIYDFACGNLVVQAGDAVIVETEKGLGFGFIATPPGEMKLPATDKPFKRIYRLARPEDFQRCEENQALERHARTFCLECIRQLGLKMHLFSVEATFDAKRLTFFFTADGRVDFRQLVKMLVKEYRVRIEMRQVGIRNQAKMCGGIGRCGRELCCCAFMENFNPVSIRMAKEQNLSLNPTKISGLCGRLMCCLTFENDTYRALKAEMPKIGKTVTTPSGKGKIIRQNVLCNRLTVRLENGEEIDLPVASLEKQKESA